MTNHSSIFAMANHPMNSLKRQKDMTWKDEPPGWNYPICHWGRKEGGQLLIVSERMKWLGKSGNDSQWWMSLW